MAHQQQIDYCFSIKQQFPHYFSNKIVVDIGSLDINGSNHYLFDNCIYIGIDLCPGKNVSMMTKGHELNLPNESIDVIISTECFEHDQFYDLTLKNCIRMLKPGGFFIFTCATTGRAEHGTKRTTPQDAPFIQNIDNWSDYYKNLEELDIRTSLPIDDIFDSHAFSINSESHDLYFWGIKKGYISEEDQKKLEIFSILKKTINEQQKCNNTLAQQISDLNEANQKNNSHILYLTQTIEAIKQSTSWKVTKSLRSISHITKKINSKNRQLK